MSARPVERTPTSPLPGRVMLAHPEVLSFIRAEDLASVKILTRLRELVQLLMVTPHTSIPLT